ncbi:hypothetical protein [Ideonella margarita]|uniref:Calcineurin-like phosphoesterase domain-containing protein n=1 Tax=Ideonella margarita TaxID=2984191 RepID=A0ABU9C7Z8_9BURK
MWTTSIRLLAAAAASLALAGCATAPQAAAPGSFSFGLWGDMPYAKAGDAPKMPALLASINASDIAFSIYDGDIKDGSSRCDDKVFDDALGMFNSLKQPVFYVPGDNEWTDCHRLNNGGFDALERLGFLRKKMYAQTGSLGQQRLPAEAQGKPGEAYVENQRFERGGVMFVTLNIPGSNNNLVLSAAECTNKSARKQAQCDAGNAEFLARDEANVRWLQESFAKARAAGLIGVVVVFQADPGFDLPETESVDESQAASVSGYRNFMSVLAAETVKYKGQVLMVHGDTHYFKLDMPLHAPGKTLVNFTRLQTFGSPSIHWVRVVVDPANPRVFSVQPVMVP